MVPEVSRISVLSSGRCHGIEGRNALGRPDAAGDRNPRHVLQFIGEQRGVEIGPEPGDEEHHLRGDEQDHAVAMRDLHHAGMIVLDFGLENDVPPPADHGVEDADGADAEDDRRVSHQMVHPQDQPDRGDEGRGGADRRPRAGIDQVVIVVRSGMCISHRHLLQIGASSSLSAFGWSLRHCPSFRSLRRTFPAPRSPPPPDPALSPDRRCRRA